MCQSSMKNFIEKIVTKFGEDAFEWSIIKEYPKDRELLESKEEQLIEQYEKEGKQLYNIHKTENK